MMIIIYKSNTGYTEQYAKLLSEQLGLPCYKLGSVPECHKGRDAIFLGWLFAGSIVGYKAASKKYHLRCVCGVGMGPPMPELVPGFREKMNIPESVKVFYLQGGFDINKLKGPMKLIMKVKCKEIAGRLNVRAELTPEEQATLRMTQTGASCVSKENLAEVVAWYK
mgnify:CR=1 FL=1